MAFQDPIVVDLGYGDVTLPRVSVEKNKSEYLNDDGTVKVVASSNYARRTRRTIRLDTNKITADPFIPSQNQKVSMSAYVVIDLPVAGYTNVQAKAVTDGLLELLSADNGAIITKLLGGQS